MPGSGDVATLNALLGLLARRDAPLAIFVPLVDLRATGDSGVGPGLASPAAVVDRARIPGPGRLDLPVEGIPEYLGFGRPGVGS